MRARTDYIPCGQRLPYTLLMGYTAKLVVDRATRAQA